MQPSQNDLFNEEQLEIIRRFYPNALTDSELQALWNRWKAQQAFEATVNYVEKDFEGNVALQRQIKGLLQTFIDTHDRPTAFAPKATLLNFEVEHDLAIQIKTYQYGQPFEPLNDQLLAAMTFFCIGEPNTPRENVPNERVLPSQHLQAVTKQLRDFTEQAKLSTIGGAVIFDRGYVANPLVSVGTIALATNPPLEAYDTILAALPFPSLEAIWQAPPPRPIQRRAHYEHHRPYQGYGNVLKMILADPNVASREKSVQLYAKNQIESPADAVVFQPLPNSPKKLVVSTGVNPRYGLLDPYSMAECAIDEAVRNALAVGTSLEQLELIVNFLWGNPDLPHRLGDLTRAAMACRDYAAELGLNFAGCYHSLGNEFADDPKLNFPNTVLISAFGIVEQSRKTISMNFKRAGNLVFLAGRTRPELGGGYYAKYHGQVEGEVPKVEKTEALRTFQAVSKAIGKDLVRSCHDLSEGGLAAAAAEMTFGSGFGIRYDLTHVPYVGSKSDRTNAALLFSETPSRFLLEVEPDQQAEFKEIMAGTVCKQIGVVLDDDEYNVIGLSTATVLRVHASELKTAWQTPIIEA